MPISCAFALFVVNIGATFAGEAQNKFEHEFLYSLEVVGELRLKCLLNRVKVIQGQSIVPTYCCYSALLSI